jgi:AhpD family alkylhydroperoxidase
MENKPSVRLVEESEATERVKDIFEEIKDTLGVKFVPNMYRALAGNPDYLETTWKKIQAVMSKENKLCSETKEIVALTVSIMCGCDYCIKVYTDAVKNDGLDDEAMLELYNVIDVYAGLNRLNIAMQIPFDDKPWHGCGAKLA